MADCTFYGHFCTCDWLIEILQQLFWFTVPVFPSPPLLEVSLVDLFPVAPLFSCCICKPPERLILIFAQFTSREKSAKTILLRI